jgi:ATP-dependent DNA helicase PIF1
VIKLNLSRQQSELAHTIMDSSSNYFVTGAAGTGKSFVLDFIRTHIDKSHVVLAPTGIAALNVKGQTIHSFFRFPLDFITADKIIISAKLKKILKELDTIIIDEISMVRVEMMDAIDIALKKARGNRKSFGGVQMILFGDLYQLPPVISDTMTMQIISELYSSPYFFDADVWRNTTLEVHELTEVYRQSDRVFQFILNSIRKGRADIEILNKINQHVRSPKQNNFITLATTNNIAENINKFNLNNLATAKTIYQAKVSGDSKMFINNVEQFLEIKVGAQVVFVRNDKLKRWYNGTIGVVSSMTDDIIKVMVGIEEMVVEPVEWNKIEYYVDELMGELKERIVGTVRQFPLKLAWAVTIHKSQGQQYDNVFIDLGAGSFAGGQSYVALSRCRSLEGLHLRRQLSSRDIIIDSRVVEFMENGVEIGSVGSTQINY